MKRNNTTFKFTLLRSVFLLSLLMFAFSCNKELENKIDIGKPGEPVIIDGKSYKVAYIVVDGAVGSVVGTQATDFNNMPYLGKLTENGLFSWNSITQDNAQDITFYADLLTGVNVAKHKVSSNDLASANLSQYPLLFDRLKSSLGLRTSVISNNEDVASLAQNSTIDNKKITSSDQETLEAAKAELALENTGFTLLTFNETDVVGKAEGYGPNSAPYVASLKNIDNKIKDVMETIQKRPNYNTEKWLLVVASNRGGEYVIDPNLDDNSLYSVPKRNNFILYYNNQFQYKIIQKMDLSDPTYDGSAIRYTGSATTATLAANKADKFNLGSTATDGEYTIQLRIKVHALGVNNPAIISKMSHTGNSVNGWSFIYNGALGWRFKIFGTQAIDPNPFVLEQWYTLTAKVYNDKGVRKARVYTNGVFVAESTITNAQGTSTEPLKLGYSTAFGTNGSHSITDVRIFNTALPDDYIATNYCSTAIYNDSPYWKNLLGYWPAIDGSGEVIKDASPNKNDFELTGTVAWNSFSERSGSLCPTTPQNLEILTIRSVDVPLMVYNWFGVKGIEKFNLDSKFWSPSFSEN